MYNVGGWLNVRVRIYGFETVKRNYLLESFLPDVTVFYCLFIAAEFIFGLNFVP